MSKYDLWRIVKISRQEIDETKKEIVNILQEELKMKIIGIIENLKEVEAPE